jgi:Tfp pilus assembly protein PilO
VKGRKIPKGTALGLIVAGDILLLLMGWFLLVSPQRSTAKTTARSVAATEAQISLARQPVQQPQAAVQPPQPEIRTAYLYKLSKAMPMTQDMPDLLLEISQVVRNAGVHLTSIQPTPPDATGATDISVSVSGDFYSLTDLLYRVRSLVAVRQGALDVSGRLFAIKSVGLTPVGTGRTLNGSITLSAFTFGSAAAAAAPTAAPTDTSTTSTDTTTSGETTSSASAESAIQP